MYLLFGTVAGFAANAVASTQIYNLGTLGGATSKAFAVNAAGQVTGDSDISSATHAFLVDVLSSPGDSMVDLGSLGVSSYGLDINALGQIVGFTDTPVGNATRAYLYTGTPGVDGVMTDLGTLGGRNSYAYSLNNAGQVVGTSNTAVSGTSHAFLYNVAPGNGGTMLSLGTLGGNSSTAYAINDNGQIAGDSSTSTNAIRAFLYNGTPENGGTMFDLGVLGTPTNPFAPRASYARDINSAGTVVGSSSTTVGSQHAFIYTGAPGNGGVMRDLGTLGSAGLESQAYGINSAGQIVGYSMTNLDDHAFLYLGVPGMGGRMIDLETWLNTANPIAGAAWLLESASDISDTGLIVGSGRFKDAAGQSYRRAFLLDAISLTGIPGDADRDRDVDFDDLLILAQSYGTASGSVWNDGDFDSDGGVEFDDLLLLAQNYGVGTSTASIETDWLVARSMVPEPSAATLLLTSALQLRRRRFC